MHQKFFKYLFESGKILIHILYSPCTPSKCLNTSKPHIKFQGWFKVINIFLSAKKRLTLPVFMALRCPLGEEGFFTLVSTPPFSPYNLTHPQNIHNSTLSPSWKRHLGSKQPQPSGKSRRHFTLLHFPRQSNCLLAHFLSSFTSSPSLPPFCKCCGKSTMLRSPKVKV